LSSFKHGSILIETRGRNSHFDVIYIVYLTDFNAKRIKCKIDKYKINNYNTSTKHEFKVKDEGY